MLMRWIKSWHLQVQTFKTQLSERITDPDYKNIRDISWKNPKQETSLNKDNKKHCIYFWLKINLPWEYIQDGNQQKIFLLGFLVLLLFLYESWKIFWYQEARKCFIYQHWTTQWSVFTTWMYLEMSTKISNREEKCFLYEWWKMFLCYWQWNRIWWWAKWKSNYTGMSRLRYTSLCFERKLFLYGLLRVGSFINYRPNK